MLRRSSNLPHLLARIIECVECRHSCREKGLCVFAEEEMRDVVALSSRIFRRDVDSTLQLRYELFAKIDRKVALRATLATVGLQEIADLVEDEVEDILLIPGRPIYITKKSGKIQNPKNGGWRHDKKLVEARADEGNRANHGNPLA